MRYGFAVAIVVAFVGLSLASDKSARRQRSVTGVVTEWRAGDYIVVANQQTDPDGFEIGVRDTVYEDNAAVIKPGVHVTVWYRNVGERRLMADRVRVLNHATR